MRICTNKMAGLYIHIPFCASRCIYCDFYSSTIRAKYHDYVDVILREFANRRDELVDSESLRSIYVGGGTPSQLPVPELLRLFDGIASVIDVKHLLEITIEANPEDVSEEWVAGIKRLNAVYNGILRVSLGVQTLDDAELRLLNRRHDSKKPKSAVRFLREAGISNISLDLMYGLPTQTLASWERSIEGILELAPEHISAYCLSVENGTRLQQLVTNGTLVPADDDLCLEMAALLRKKLHAAGYVQYEISNFSKPGFESKHNSGYWNGTPYIGLGPGAHSYDGKRRRTWNECNLTEYLRGNCAVGEEFLSDRDLFNEKIMLGLRTSYGVELSELEQLYKLFEGKDFHLSLPPNLKSCIEIKNNRLKLTEQGLALADEVIRELMA